jgi:hypothetical protein
MEKLKPNQMKLLFILAALTLHGNVYTDGDKSGLLLFLLWLAVSIPVAQYLREKYKAKQIQDNEL